MRFEKHISCDEKQRTYILAEPITINNTDRFVKIKYLHQHGSIAKAEEREIIINCDLISTGI